MVYTITLNPALDYVMRLDCLKYDDINRASDDELHYGGKGINVSVVLNRLGVDNVAMGFVGGFTGAKLEQMLIDDGISCDFNYLKNGYTRINVKLKADTEIDVNASGPTINMDDICLLADKLKNIQDGDFVVLAGSIPKGLPSNVYEQLVESFADKKVNLVVDTSGDVLKSVLKYKPFLIKPNHHELGELFGTTVEEDNDIEFYARKLQEMGARNVLVSRASKGAMLIDENGVTSVIGTAKGKLVDSVGCGDSMVAGFVAGFLQKSDYNYALQLGTACGCATAFSSGLADKENVYSLLDAGFEL